MVDHAVHDGGGDDGIAEVVAELAEVNVRRDERARLAVAAVDDLEEERGVPGVLLFQPIEAEFVDEEDVGGGVVAELPGKGVVGPAREERRKGLLNNNVYKYRAGGTSCHADRYPAGRGARV